MRNLQEQVKKAFCYQKLFWPYTVWINCSSDLKNFANSRPSVSNFKSFSRSLEQFFLTVGQNNFGNKIPLLTWTVHKRRRHFFRMFDTPSPMSALFYFHPSAVFEQFLNLPHLYIVDVLYGRPHVWKKKTHIKKKSPVSLLSTSRQDNHGQIWNYYVKVIKQEKCKCLWDLEKRYRVFYGKNKRTHRLYTIVYSVYSILLVLNNMMLW